MGETITDAWHPSRYHVCGVVPCALITPSQDLLLETSGEYSSGGLGTSRFLTPQILELPLVSLVSASWPGDTAVMDMICNGIEVGHETIRRRSVKSAVAWGGLINSQRPLDHIRHRSTLAWHPSCGRSGPGGPSRLVLLRRDISMRERCKRPATCPHKEAANSRKRWTHQATASSALAPSGYPHWLT